MSTSAEKQKSDMAKAIENCVVFITGKITGKRTYNNISYYLVVCPAPDEYSHPATIEMSSDDASKQIGDTIGNVKCRVSGRQDKWTDKQSGELVKTARMYINEIT